MLDEGAAAKQPIIRESDAEARPVQGCEPLKLTLKESKDKQDNEFTLSCMLYDNRPQTLTFDPAGQSSKSFAL